MFRFENIGLLCIHAGPRVRKRGNEKMNNTTYTKDEAAKMGKEFGKDYSELVEMGAQSKQCAWNNAIKSAEKLFHKESVQFGAWFKAFDLAFKS